MARFGAETRVFCIFRK